MTNPAAVFAALAQEPWCFSPAVIAEMTVWQAVNVYLKPAAERAERAKTGGEPKPPGHDWSELPQRAEFVGQMLAAFGGEAESWGRQWDAMNQCAEGV